MSSLNIKEILDTKVINCSSLVKLIEDNIITKKMIQQDIQINKIVIGNENIDSVRFIDYIVYMMNFSYEISDIEKIINLLQEKFGENIINDITCIKIKTIEHFFDNYIILPVYNIFLNKYYNKNNKKKRIECNICYSHNVSVNFQPCNHKCCIICSAKIKKKILKCHICRSFIFSMNIDDI